MIIRGDRQQEAVQAYLNSDRRTILYCCPRFGKIKVALDIMKADGINHVWILAPRNDIFEGWNKDMDKFGFRPERIHMTTFTSIKKLDSRYERPQLVIIDEPHEMSVNQQMQLANIIPISKDQPVLGLTGTMTNKTRRELYDSLNLDVCYTYSIAQGVEEGILTDYEIVIHEVALDDKRYDHATKAKKYTEQGYFNLYEYLRKEAQGHNKRIMELKMINIIQNSIAKMEATRRLISTYKYERILVFCGVTAVADQLGIPVYHSKAKEKAVFDSFCAGEGDYLATIKMMQAGITVAPIHRGIMNYLSGSSEDGAQKICRFLGFEYGNPNKKAYLDIVSSKEPFERERLVTALQFFDENKITRIS